MKKLLIVATSSLKPEQATHIAEREGPSRKYPDVEYVKLAQATGADFLNYSLYDRLFGGQILKKIETMIRSDMTLAITTLRRARNYQAVLAMSERVGIPLAFLKRSGLLQSKLILRFTAWSKRQNHLFQNLNLLPFIDQFIVESQPLGDLLQKEFGVPTAKITFIPYAIDHHFFCSQSNTFSYEPLTEMPLPKQSRSEGLNVNSNKPLILSAGEVRGRDYPTLVEATAPLTTTDVHIAASGTWFAREKNTALHGELPAHITIGRRYNPTEMRSLYARATCVVVPLADQPFSAGITVALEAMAMGKPLIVSRSAGLAGYLSDGENCMFVEPSDTMALRRAVCYLLENPEEAQRLAENARNRIEEVLNLEIYVQRLAAAIAQIDRPTFVPAFV